MNLDEKDESINKILYQNGYPKIFSTIQKKEKNTNNRIDEDTKWQSCRAHRDEQNVVSGSAHRALEAELDHRHEISQKSCIDTFDFWLISRRAHRRPIIVCPPLLTTKPML